MKVKLRERNQGGKTSLYLDYYENGNRKNKTLKLYLHSSPKNKEERDENKLTMALAKKIEASEILKCKAEEINMVDVKRQDGDFKDFLELLAKDRLNSNGNYGNWKSMITHFNAFHKGSLKFSQVNMKFVEDFKNYLDKKARTKKSLPLSANSKYSYFNKFKAALKEAVRYNHLSKNPSQFVKSFPQEETTREFLSLDELKKALTVPCENELMKKAFIFGCLTGLRWSDIVALRKEDLHFSEELGYQIRFRQKKTKGNQYHPISARSLDFLPEPLSDNYPYFKGLKYNNDNNDKLRKWLKKSGIDRYITFHCSRHTYATLQLNAETDIYTVSKLLGHKHLKTTEVYAKVIDNRKQLAANKIEL